MAKKQIDVANEIETILIESGLYYRMMYNPETKEYVFVLTSDDDPIAKIIKDQ